jgi:heptosyltransferase-2
MNPYIDRVLPFDWRSAAHLPVETFDAIFSFERSPAAAALTDRIHASKKAGLSYGGSENSLYAVGDAARHFFLMNTWNDFRTQRNTKSWTELYFEVAGYTYEGEPYILQIPPAVDRKVRMLLGEKSSSGRVCLNVGGSLSTKIWPRDHWLALGAALLAAGHDLVITGGPTDQMVCDYLVRALSAHDSSGHRIRCHRTSIEEFAAVPAYCDVVVTGDSLGFHLALAHRRPCVLLLGPSSGSEVIPKHVTNVVALRSSLPCSPCAHQVSCGGIGGCMDTISSNQVLREVENFLTIR